MNLSILLPRRYYNIILSLSIITIWACAMLFMSKPDDQDSIDELVFAFFLYATLSFALFIGVIASTVRIIGYIKDPANFLYSFSGVLNFCLGLLGIYLVTENQLGKPWALFFIFSLVIGCLMMLDMLLKRNVGQRDVNGEW